MNASRRHTRQSRTELSAAGAIRLFPKVWGARCANRFTLADFAGIFDRLGAPYTNPSLSQTFGANWFRLIATMHASRLTTLGTRRFDKDARIACRAIVELIVNAVSLFDDPPAFIAIPAKFWVHAHFFTPAARSNSRARIVRQLPEVALGLEPSHCSRSGRLL